MTLALKAMEIPQYRMILYQLIPIVVILLPFFEVVGLTVYWRRSLSSSWLFGFMGTVLAYAVTVGVVFTVEKFTPNRGSTIITSSAPVWRDEGRAPTQVQVPEPRRSGKAPLFEPLTPSWFGLLATILVLCGISLWGLTFLFRRAVP